MAPVVVADRRSLRRRAPARSPVCATASSGSLRALGELLDRMAVAVARREVHLARRRRAGSSRSICSTTLTRSKNSGQSIDDSSRMLRDDVADRELIGRLALMLAAQQLFGRVALRLERALQRQPRRRRRRRLIAQPLQQLDDEGRRRAARSPRLGAQQRDRISASRSHARLRRASSPSVRACSRLRRAGDDAVDQAPQLLDQRQPQHDRDRPRLADRQRRRRADRRRRSRPASRDRAGRRCARSARARSGRRAGSPANGPSASFGSSR